MRVSELVPRVKNKRFFLPFLTLGTSTKLLGFMRVLAILDPLEISSGGCTPGMPASCVPQGRKGPSKTSGVDVHEWLDQARASARRSKARIDSGGTPRLEMGKCTTTAQTRINTGVFIVVQVYKNRRKRTRIEESVQEWGILVHPDNNGKPHKHWVFSILVHFWISSRGVYKNPVSVLLPGGEASLWRELWKTP